MHKRTVSTLALLAAVGTSALGGPITPPPGPVAGTYKTLIEVEPRTAINAVNTRGDANSTFRIAAPGSYYLTGNVTGEANKHGIEIAADNVSIDMMGFHVVGVSGSLSGIATEGTRRSVRISGGTLSNWGWGGIQLAATGAVIADVAASGNGADGIDAGDSAVVRSCTASFNGATGITTGLGGLISECVAAENTLNGFTVGFGNTIIGCSAYRNDGRGIAANTGSIVENNAIRLNMLDGISAGSMAVVRGNVCSSNGSAAGGSGAGIRINGVDCRVESNTCISNDIGIRVVSSGNMVIRNTASGNGTNFDIAGGNRYGPIIDATAGGTPAVTGNEGAGTMLSGDPWANFAY